MLFGVPPGRACNPGRAGLYTTWIDFRLAPIPVIYRYGRRLVLYWAIKSIIRIAYAEKTPDMRTAVGIKSPLKRRTHHIWIIVPLCDR